jgi:ABC-2 type transport system permease protein
VKLLAHEVKVEQLLFWRNREAAFFTFLLPILFFLIFASVYGNDRIKKEGNIRAKDFLEAGMVGYGVASTAFAGLAITMVIRRESGVLKRIRATPLPPATYLTAVLTSTFVVFLVEVVLIVAIGRGVFGIPVPHALGSLFGALVLGAACFAAMGLGLTSAVRSAEGASAVVNFVYLPMAIISGTFFTPRQFPTFLRWIADVLPLTYFTKLTRNVMLRHEHLWSQGGSIAVLAAWGAVGLAAAILSFRWQPREA